MVLVAGGVEVKQRKPGGCLNKRRTGRYAGRVRLAVVPDRSAQSLGGFIERTVKPGAAIITDDWSGYAKLGIRGYCHTAVAERVTRVALGANRISAVWTHAIVGS